MKKSLYTLTILCIGVIIGMTSTTYAAPAKEFVQAYFAKIKFVVNGEEKPLDADPLVYQGTTYLPVRTVLNALGYDAGYKADTKTVTADKDVQTNLSEADSKPQKEGEQIDMIPVNSQDVEKQIESLNKSLTDEKEKIETIKQLIQDAKGRTDVSEELKTQKIEGYNKLIEFSEKTVKMLEDKITELKK